MKNLGILMLLTLTLFGCGGHAARSTQIAASDATKDRGPLTVELELLGGGVWSSTTAQGKPLLMVLFASWCESCFFSLRQLDLLREDPAFQGRFEAVGVLIDAERSKEVEQDLLTGTPIGFPIVRSNPQFREDMKRQLRVSGVPASCILDQAGRMVESFEGSPPVVYLVRRTLDSAKESK